MTTTAYFLELVSCTSALAQLTQSRLDMQFAESLNGNHLWHFHLAASWCEIAEGWQEQWPSLQGLPFHPVEGEKLLLKGAREEGTLSTGRELPVPVPLSNFRHLLLNIYAAHLRGGNSWQWWLLPSGWWCKVRTCCAVFR